MRKDRLISLPSLKEAARRDLKHSTLEKGETPLPDDRLKVWAGGKKFCIRTYGCQANVRDSENIKSLLLNIGMTEVFVFEESDLIIFNTCAVRENAENHLYGELGRAKAAYDKNRKLIVAVCGCVMQEEGPCKKVLETFPFVSLVFGTNNISSLYTLLSDSVFNNERIVDVRSQPSFTDDAFCDVEGSRYSKVSAFVNIMYGCDKFCTYCIVPYTRGKERSRKEEDILREVVELKNRGYRQVTLLGQNVDAYGKDFGDEYAFASLLEKVAQTGIERIRFTTPYPSDFRVEVFDVMAKYPNIMPSLHLPLQSGSDTVLKRMNRRYTREQYLQIVHELRTRLPDVFLTTDIIVGFPNETDRDFEDTISLCNEVKYDSAYTFIYSPREGTPTAKMKDGVSEKTKHERFDRLVEVINGYAEKKADSFVGTRQEVLFEEVSKRNAEMISGYDRHGKLVHVKGDPSLIGQIRKVRITESHTFSLIGELDD